MPIQIFRSALINSRDKGLEVIWQDGPIVGLRFLIYSHEVAGALLGFLPPECPLVAKSRSDGHRPVTTAFLW